MRSEEGRVALSVLAKGLRLLCRRRAGESLFSGWIEKKDKPLRAVGCRYMVREKRASPRASVTVEASIALPLYIFFFVNILTAFDILRMQDDLTAALHQTGNRIAQQAFDIRYAADALRGAADGPEEETLDEAASEEEMLAEEPAEEVFSAEDAGTLVFTAATLGASVREYLGEEYLAHSVVDGGSEGLSFLNSRIMLRADEIDLVASFRVKPFIPGFIAFRSYPVEARYFGHAWTGYEPGGAGVDGERGDDPIVYVTEHGTVYHRNLNCSHLRLSVRSIQTSEVLDARNAGGSRYTPCEICGGYTNGRGIAYIAENGDRIHSTVNCPGLKRTIRYIHLSEVGGLPPCSRCGW